MGTEQESGGFLTSTVVHIMPSSFITDKAHGEPLV